MNQELWLNAPFELPCYVCKKGTISIIKGSIQSTETRESLLNNEYHRNGLVNPDVVRNGSAHLKCDNCDESLIMTYQVTEDVRHVDEEGNEYCVYDNVRYFPSPPLIDIPQSCPTRIKVTLESSFTLFWIDLASCANKLRVALEALMNELSIGDISQSLHYRIKKLVELKPDIGSFLMSVKWIGNSGSHLEELTKAAIIDAYRLIEYALEQIYNDRHAELLQLSKRINDAQKHQ